MSPVVPTTAMTTFSEDGEAEREDDNWCFVSAWEPAGENKFIRHAEPLYFDKIPLMTRNYK